MHGPIRIGLLGAGVVGEGIVHLLADNRASIERRLGAPIFVQRVVARNANKARSEHLQGASLSFDPDDVLESDEVDIVVEVIGGVSPASQFVRRAIERGRSVVTANKALLAVEGHELIELAEAKGVDLYFEAAVAGGIPVVRVLREALASDRIVELRGIVNGTSNYILSTMTEQGISFDEAVVQAQAKGFAEADPTLDINGGDAAHKLTILATLAFGARVTPDQVVTEGLQGVTATDIAMAAEFGFIIKPLAFGRMAEGGELELRVHPALVPRGSVFANIGGALNVVELHGAMLGPCLLSGQGAGALPTAMSVVSDIVDVGRNLVRGASGRVPQRAWRGEHLADHPVLAADEGQGRYYLRFVILDRPDLLGRILGVLGAFDVSVQRLSQEARKDPSAPDDTPAVQVVMITHPTRRGGLVRALREMQQLHGILEAPRHIRIES